MLPSVSTHHEIPRRCQDGLPRAIYSANSSCPPTLARLLTSGTRCLFSCRLSCSSDSRDELCAEMRHKGYSYLAGFISLPATCCCAGNICGGTSE